MFYALQAQKSAKTLKARNNMHVCTKSHGIQTQTTLKCFNPLIFSVCCYAFNKF